ncbi:hypothetical protein MN608_02636 [Microdochium nivale]|nr:hypothetical protein MN608_02636 [Microdochium nivale]
MHDASFFTRTIPDVPSTAYIIGLCSVPSERAGPDDQGWHIADFLAWKTLFRGHGSAKSQAWLSLCEIAQIVKSRPAEYTHGPERAIVQRASAATLDNVPGVGLCARDDHVHVESTGALADKFSDVVAKFSAKAHAEDVSLVIFLCGPTNLGQDIYLGDTAPKARIRSHDIHKAMPVDGLGAVVVSAAPFSVGWQVNPLFCGRVPRETRAERVAALGSHPDGLSTRQLQDVHLSGGCPWPEKTRVGAKTARNGKEAAAQGPLLPNARQLEAVDSVKDELSRPLSSRGLVGPQHPHAFSFDADRDDWEAYVGPREGWSLADLESRWSQTPKASLSLSPPLPPPERLGFLGSAFGGRRTSQLSHIRHLVRDALLSSSAGSTETHGSDRRELRQRDLEWYQLSLEEEDRDLNDLQWRELLCLLVRRATDTAAAQGGRDRMLETNGVSDGVLKWHSETHLGEEREEISSSALESQTSQAQSNEHNRENTPLPSAPTIISIFGAGFQAGNLPLPTLLPVYETRTCTTTTTTPPTPPTQQQKRLSEPASQGSGVVAAADANGGYNDGEGRAERVMRLYRELHLPAVLSDDKATAARFTEYMQALEASDA